MRRISLVLSDVDGTLVRSDKRLAPATVAAVRRLGESGIRFTVASSRPAFGLRMLVEPLALALPMGAFNGSALVEPDLSPIEQHAVPRDAASRALEVLTSFGVDIWVFTFSEWLLGDPGGAYVEQERRTVQSDPRVVESFDGFLSATLKIVGVSRDFARLAECEAAMREALAGTAFAARSQPYYLDVTAPGLDKGTALDAVALRLGIPLVEVAVIGDMDNDLPMFRKAGFAIAMGNAPPEVKAEAEAVTLGNDEDGVAAAIDRYVLGDAAGV
jgi:Cof subfamily protein (haloacid dehalogenase superfamily)